MILLLGVVVVGFILGVTYIEHDRNEIQKKQQELEKENNILKAKLDAEETRQHKEMLEREYNPQV